MGGVLSSYGLGPDKNEKEAEKVSMILDNHRAKMA